MSSDQSKCKISCKITDPDGFVRRETLNIFLGMLDESELDQAFEEEMDNIKRDIIFYRYLLICFIRLLQFSRFFAEYFKSLCLPH